MSNSTTSATDTISSTSSSSTPVSLTPTTSTQPSSTPPPSTSTPSPTTTPTSTTTTPQQTTTTPTNTGVLTTVTVIETPSTAGGSTRTVIQTSTAGLDTTSSRTGTATSSSSSGASTADPQSSGKTSSSGLGSGGTIAVAVVVPIVAVALLVLIGLFLWRRRKAKKDAEEMRRKEVEEYNYNPNNDPTLPAVGGGSTGGDGPYEMREDGSSGYRGWGTTAVASSGRKASTTLSGGQSAGGIGMAYSEGTSPTHGPVSDTRSDNPLMDGRPLSGEQEALGAMGPAASGNRNTDINRGPSNASSSYSAANRSDGSGELPGSYGAGYNNQYDTGNPYSPETQYGSPPGRSEMPAQPVIRDVQARRNTRIENPSHFPQQSAGISQNF